MKKIILASSSPRRKELLKQIGFKFKVIPSCYEENMTLKMKPAELAKHLSKMKALEVAQREKTGLIISADTFIVLGNEILGKPHTAQKAHRTLKKISGKTLSVVTGFTVLDSENKKIKTKAVSTKVFIKKLTEKEINDYIATSEPLDKAGAFGIQGRGALFIKKIEGDYNNVVGLPIYELG